MYSSCQDSGVDCLLFDIQDAKHGCFGGFAVKATFQPCNGAVFFHQKYTHGKLFPYIWLQILNIKKVNSLPFL